MAVPAAPLPAADAQRIAFISSGGSSLRQLHELLLKDIASQGHRVLVIAPELSDGASRRLTEIGAEHATIAPEAAGLKLFADWKSIGGLKQSLSDWAPDVVVTSGAQTMVHGALAAKGAGVQRVILIVDGLPEHRFSGPLAADEMPAWRYGQALRAAHAVVFHNRDDHALLKKLGLVPPALPVAVVPGGGVDLEGHSVLSLPPLDHGLVFLMIGGLDRRRGVMDYCAAAEKLRQRSPTSRFLLAVQRDEGALPIDIADIADIGRCVDVEFLGFAERAADFLAEAHVFVYPGYAEGMPEPLLKALASGRPVVTADAAGCRDVVDTRINGCLFAPRDADALADAMESFLRRPDLIPAMARASRAKAERMQTSAAVRSALMDLMQLR
jgi:glycosyltransferase involved in cell wall biosynthesis